MMDLCPGTEAMEFLFATKPHFRVADLAKHPELVRALGLGGKNYLDYCDTPGRPRLRTEGNDYTELGGELLD